MVVKSDSLVTLSNCCVLPECSPPSNPFVDYDLNLHDCPELGLPTGSFATGSLCQPESIPQFNQDPQPSILNEDIFQTQPNSAYDFADVATGYFDTDPGAYIWKANFEAGFDVSYPETHSSSFYAVGEWDNFFEPLEMTSTMDASSVSLSVEASQIELSSLDPSSSRISPDTLQSGSEVPSLKRSRSSSSPPPQSDREFKRLKHTTDEPCLWVRCSEVFEDVSQLRLAPFIRKTTLGAYF